MFHSGKLREFLASQGSVVGDPQLGLFFVLSIHGSSPSQRDELSHSGWSCVQNAPRGFAMKAVGVIPTIQPLWLILPDSVHEL